VLTRPNFIRNPAVNFDFSKRVMTPLPKRSWNWC